MGVIMKVLRFATRTTQESIGILLEDGVLNFTEAFQAFQLFDQGVCACPVASPMALMEAGLFSAEVFSQVLDFVDKHNLSDKFKVRKYKALAPIKRPSKILALGRNYLAHAKESGYHIPTEPIFFGKVNSAVIGPDEPVVYKKSLTRVDPEIELAVIIGKEGANIPEADAPAHIAGYTIMNDVTARDMQRVDMEQSSPWTRSKGIDTFCPMGPVIVLPDEIQEPIELDLELKVNGEPRQKDNTHSLMFKIPKLIEYISSYHTLFPGDVISTGTPEGMKPVFPGDIMEAHVEKIGTLRNPVVAEA